MSMQESDSFEGTNKYAATSAAIVISYASVGSECPRAVNVQNLAFRRSGLELRTEG
jgi:hypothetical protein